ncbi:hypothetical protein CPB83DRAFT_842209 [Crepidotus variabilis]|uniref:Uncharacterized protein n=1 Tax=Crepidotus variabilis TaxID=179855 RepID=A0A9P6JWX6_9AGAR|nr:hypothetical protein CPB83DRAFT_842209 [Crepidotus variabilis]
MSSSLSSVVSGLVRAQMGASVPSSVTNDDLDRHVAELIVKEAKKKAELYMQKGVRAYTTNSLSDSNAPRANKRFLSSIIKSTDEHNRTILKAQSDAAEEVKRERREQERQQRRLRAQEAVEARRSGGESSRRRSRRNEEDTSEGWDRWDGRTEERKKLSRNWETWDGYDEDAGDREKEERRRRSRSRERDTEKPSRPSKRVEGDDPERSSKHRRRSTRSRSPRRRHKSLDRDEDSDSRRRKRRRVGEESYRRSRPHTHSRSRSPAGRTTGTDDRKSKKRRRSRSPKYALDDLRDETSSPEPRKRSSPSTTDSVATAREAELRQHLKNSKKAVLSDQVEISARPKASTSTSRRSLTPMTISRSPTPGPQPAANLPSKMDRYFEESYDPRLDVEPLAPPQVPATGLINDAEFEGWDAMLELIRVRREDKLEKKRLERLGLLPEKDKSLKVKKKGPVEPSSAAVAERWGADAINVMDIEYSKKGSVREWDLGKEGF